MDAENNNIVYVPKESYIEIIGFTTYAYLTNKITKYSGIAGGRTRNLGEFIESFIYGKLAEEAFKIFLKEKLSLEVLTELDIADFYYGAYLPDIVAIKRNENYEWSKFWIDVKETRRDQKWLLVSASSIRTRPYDGYGAVKVDLPQEHLLLWLSEFPLIKNKMSSEWFNRVIEVAEKIEKISCTVQGFVTYQQLTSNENNAVESKGSAHYFNGEDPLYDPYDSSWSGAVVGENYGYFLSDMQKIPNWEENLKIRFEENQRIISYVPIPKTKSGIPSKKIGLPGEYAREYEDLRDAYQSYLENQLNSIRNKNNGCIKRSTSWFSQKL